MEKCFGLLLIVLFILRVSNGCQMEGVVLWPVPVTQSIYDTFRGTVMSRSTTDIEGIRDVTYGEGMIGGPYLEVSHSNSQFVMTTKPEYENYEEIESLSSMSLTVTFACTGGTTNTLIFLIDVIDTNNNAPQFIPSSQLEFVVTPPLPPGFLVTGCLSYITVRDIDLTTQRIDFTIEDNPYFEIEYDADSSVVAKEFNAVLRTTALIRSLSEPITLTISATDVDLTGDPPLTTTATVTIIADSQFELPEEPVFNQAFYVINYTDDHQLVQTQTIYLEQGFDEYVNFTLEGDFVENFSLRINGNQVTVVVTNPLPNEALASNQIYLIIRANRENTSGGTATIIIQFPEESRLSFESSLYIGTIENNTLILPPLVLIEGYENTSITVRIEGEYSSNFAAFVEGNLVTLTMDQLNDVIIDNNSFISLEVVALSVTSEAITIVSLEIIKEDNVTPVFDKSIYHGTYDPVTGLDIEQIVFVQGLDDTVNIRLLGEHSSYFDVNREGNIVTVTTTYLPEEIFVEHNVILSLQAEKPRTVGANAAIIITLPAAKELLFEEDFYKGTIQDNVLTLQDIRLEVGYDDNVIFSLSGEYSEYFNISNTDNIITIVMVSPLSDIIITQNSVILLTLTASGVNTISSTTTILLNIIKDDNTTPIFSRNIYYGTYFGPSNIEIEPITLSQGYDSGVSFKLDGEHAQYFELAYIENNATLILQTPIPEDVIFNEKVLLFSILADKAFTVGANAVILIRFPTELTEPIEMKFSQNTYIGTIENDDFKLENITLNRGYEEGTLFTLTGDLYSHFALSTTNNIVQITYLNTLPIEAVADNDLIILEIEASRERAVTTAATIIVNIVKNDTITPRFNQPYYVGTYKDEFGLQFNEIISLSEGYDERVIFYLDGESSQWFSLSRNDNVIVLELNSTIPLEIVENNDQLLFTIIAINEAGKGYAVIAIELTKDFNTDSLRFTQQYYKGFIENENLIISLIKIDDSFIPLELNYTLTGEFAEYFQIEYQQGTFELTLPAPAHDNIKNADVIILVLETQTVRSESHTVLVIEVIKDAYQSQTFISFDATYYSGTYTEISGLQMFSTISLETGFNSNIEFTLEEENSEWFGLIQNENSVSLTLSSPIPAGVLANNQQLIFVITAEGNNTNTARATIVISLTDVYTEEMYLAFERVSYLGSIKNDQVNIPDIILSEGYTENVTFSLYGEFASYFALSWQGSTVTITLSSSIPEASKPANGIVVLEIHASAPPALPAYTTLIIEIVRDNNIVTPNIELAFAEAYYTGTYNEGSGLEFSIPISLSTGYSTDVEFSLEGDSSEWFGLIRNENSISLTLTSPIPAGVLANNHQLIFVITAQGNDTNTARATIVISLTDVYTEGLYLAFERVSYVGSLENDQVSIPEIVLSEGYTENVTFSLHGEFANYFALSWQGSTVTITLSSSIPEALKPANGIVVLEIQASAPPALPAYSTLIIELVRDSNIVSPNIELTFAEAYYIGTYNEGSDLEFNTPISLSTGYSTDVVFSLEGDSSEWFGLIRNENSISLTLTSPIPAGVLANNHQLIFVIAAQGNDTNTARATIVISLTDVYTEGLYLAFERVSYVGSIQNDQVNIPEIILSEGYTENVTFSLHGEFANYFALSWQGSTVTITLSSSIPEALKPANGIVVLEIQASAPPALPTYTTLIIELVVNDSQVESNVSFSKILYEGVLEDNVVFHETIIVYGYSGPYIELAGEYASLFNAVLNNGVVTIQKSNSLTVTVTHIPLEIRAGSAGAVLLINVRESDGIESTPVVTFGSQSYTIRVDITQTGTVGQVEAIADNGEAVTYSLHLNNAHLEGRLSINNVGELHLSAPVNSGFYTFQVLATTVFTQISGSATIYLSVETVTVCDNELVMPPLIILDRDEEEPHRDLINGTDYQGCRFLMTNRWPLEQDWLYVDEAGLHTTAIDREHESIAFMPLSQVQVEVTLHCDGDTERVKRSLNSDSLGPYDYGNNKWLLTDTILFNSRRTLLNLIVNDINDNAPIFDGKSMEPIAVGCPIPELQGTVIPRSLAELHATDADIGENAAITYWSSNQEIAVSPTSGFVHLRDGATLEQNTRLTVHATDRNGQGLTGSIELIVKLLDEDNIAVLTVRDAFLDDETAIITYFKDAVGYDLKILRSAVVTFDNNETRNKREIFNNLGATLQLYIYGLVNREPVSASRIIEDINSSDVALLNIASSVSLGDHLTGQEICVVSARETGLLVATIVLSVLLFIIIVLIAVWYFLLWRRKKNYDQFSDENSLASRNESVEEIPKPEVTPIPRLNIEELKKSERRLQEMLNAPLPKLEFEEETPKQESIMDIPLPDPNATIVIQSFDKLKDAEDESSGDEFGENKSPRRKSVVTFNENVEKIIHLEDNNDSDTGSELDTEVYKF